MYFIEQNITIIFGVEDTLSVLKILLKSEYFLQSKGIAENGTNRKYRESGIYSQECYLSPPWQLIFAEFIFKNENIFHALQLSWVC